MRLKKNIGYEHLIASSILLGHGVKPFGYALLDEVFPFLFFKKTFSFKKLQLLNLGFLLGLWFIISSLIAMYTNSGDLPYKAHLCWIGVCILIVSQIPFTEFQPKHFFFAACAYFFLNFGFVLVEQLVFLWSGGAAVCLKTEGAGGALSFEVQNDLTCVLSVYFWQQFWSGTAYSSLGVWFSWLVLNSRAKTRLGSYLLITLFLLIAFFQLSKAMVIFALLSSFLVINNKQDLKTLFLIAVGGVIAELCLWTIPVILEYENFEQIATHVVNSYFLGVSKEIIFNVFDQGRSQQLSSMILYLQQADLAQLIFGNGTGAHRYDLIEFIPYDSSGLLRPVGVVAWLFDYGLAFIFLLLLTASSAMFKIINISKDLSLFKKLQISSVFSYICALPLVTNLNDSILFWVLILFPQLIVKFTNDNHINGHVGLTK